MTEQPTTTPASRPAPDANAFFIKFNVKPGKNADFEKAMEDMLAEVRQKEPGNIYCELLRFAQNSQTYSVMERFTDAEAVKAHADSSYIKNLADIFQKGDLLDGAPEIQELIHIRSK